MGGWRPLGRKQSRRGTAPSCFGLGLRRRCRLGGDTWAHVGTTSYYESFLSPLKVPKSACPGRGDAGMPRLGLLERAIKAAVKSASGKGWRHPCLGLPPHPHSERAILSCLAILSCVGHVRRQRPRPDAHCDVNAHVQALIAASPSEVAARHRTSIFHAVYPCITSSSSLRPGGL